MGRVLSFMASSEPAPGPRRETQWLDDAPIVLAHEAPVRIGPLTIEPAMRRVIHDNGQEAFLEPRVMQALVALVRADGRILSRDDMMAQCWSGRVVGEDALNRVVARLRRLSEGLAAGVFNVETIAKVGHRLVTETAAGARGSEASARRNPGARRAGALPRRLTRLIGRDVELREILAQLQSVDLVTITGAGGVGKTRIAHQVGQSLVEDYKDGVWLVELAPVADPAQVPGAVSRAMGLDLPTGHEAQAALVERLTVRDCLIILDNCEHLIGAVADLAAGILERCSTVKIVATSQDLLRIEGEQVFALQPLAENDAVQLFCERARSVDPSFDPAQQDADAIVAICRQLDGIPLAIEMAAAQAPRLRCDGLLSRLDDRFRLLTGGRRTALPRHRTLIATLDWSHDLLSEREAAVFRRLSVFSGGFSLDAAAAVCACERWDGIEVVEALAELVAKSLVASETAWGARRYRLLETTRNYASNKLTAAGEIHETQRSHADHFRNLAAQSSADYRLRPVSDDSFAERYFGEVDNVARAIDWAFGPKGDAQAGIALTVDATGLMQARSLHAESAAWLERAVLRLDSDTPAALRARLLGARAMSYVWVSPAKAVELAPEAIEVCRAHGDALSLHAALWAKAFALVKSGRVEELATVVAEMVTLLEHMPSPARIPAITKYWIWRTAFVLDPSTAPADPLDATITELRSFGAEGETMFYRCWRLFYYAPSDINLMIDEWRTLLGDLNRAYFYGDLIAPLIVGQLMAALARRSGPEDLDESLELGRRYSRIDILYEGFHTSAGLAWVALKTGRGAIAGRLVGRLGRISGGFGDIAFERTLFNILLAALKAELTDAELDVLMADGARLSADDARRLVLGG